MIYFRSNDYRRWRKNSLSNFFRTWSRWIDIRGSSRESESKRKEWKDRSTRIDATGNVRYATKNRTTSFIFQSVARAAVVSFFARREKSSETYIQKSLSTRRRKTVFFDSAKQPRISFSLSLHRSLTRWSISSLSDTLHLSLHLFKQPDPAFHEIFQSPIHDDRWTFFFELLFLRVTNV